MIPPHDVLALRQVYASESEWGLRFKLQGSRPALSGFGGIKWLNKIWTSIGTLDASFSISGPTQLSSRGQVQVTFTSGASTYKFMFCYTDSNCPSGFSCDLGLCLKWGCRSGFTLSDSKLTCARDCNGDYCAPGAAGAQLCAKADWTYAGDSATRLSCSLSACPPGLWGGARAEPLPLSVLLGLGAPHTPFL